MNDIRLTLANFAHRQSLASDHVSRYTSELVYDPGRVQIVRLLQGLQDAGISSLFFLANAPEALNVQAPITIEVATATVNEQQATMITNSLFMIR